MENKILITGCAGFIGYHLTKKFCEKGFLVLGIDNLNDYYDARIKDDRLSDLKKNINFSFKKIDISDEGLVKIFKDNSFSHVIHLAAQAGVRYSISNPFTYIKSNITGFVNILECCKSTNIKSIFYASSSSVYGNQNSTNRMREVDMSNKPVSLYGATKLSNEIIANVYKELYDINSIGLRFFTVYGPYGRPDMAYYGFTKSILENKKIKIFNNGKHKRAFTYIDDVTHSIFLLFEKFKNKKKFHKIYNVGNNESISLLDFIKNLEKLLNKKAIKQNFPKQLGDVDDTSSDCSKLEKEINYQPKIKIDIGLKKFIDWYKEYHSL